MKTLKIDRERLEELTTKAVTDMINFSWSGWKIDILVDNDGKLWRSAKNTNNVYPESIVLFSIAPVEYVEDDYYTEDDCVANEVSEYMSEFEGNIAGNMTLFQEFYNVELYDIHFK